MHSTARLAIPIPDATDPVTNYPAVAASAAAIADNAAIYLPPGTISARPAAGSVAAGSFYDATGTGLLSKSNGTVWVTVFTGDSGFLSLTFGPDTQDAHVSVAATPTHTCYARVRGDRVDLGGAIYNPTLSTIAAGTTLFTVPSAAIPTSNSVYTNVGPYPLVINTSGVATSTSAWPLNPAVVGLDGCGYFLSG